MDLKTFLSNIPLDERDQFAKRCGTTFKHLRNVGYGYRSCSAAIAAAVERESKGKVSRKSLRKEDWASIWPDLKKRAA